MDFFECILFALTKFLESVCLSLKKVRKTTRPFRYDLNEIPYDYTMEVTNRFKGLDLIECLKNYGLKFMTLYRRPVIKTSPREKKNAKSKMVV